ncbi:MAG: RluA family pseudouridine synthase [Elusimicrobiota bacterium]
MTLRILHEDARLIIVDKPSGQPVIPGRGVEPGSSLVEQVSRHLEAKAFVVHRIDRETSGIVLFAKDAAAHRDICLLFEAGRVEKTYQALVLGAVSADGCVDKPLREFGSGRMGVAENGKPYKTVYKVLERLRGASLLTVEPRTGRRHQIRAHLYSIGHPVLGDKLYGKPVPVGGAVRLMLHARQLRLGWGKSRIEIESPLPPDFSAALESFR